MKRITLLMFSMLLTVSMWALTMPHVFSDGMMLQQRANARLWGWAAKGAEVTVSCSWDGKAYSARADRKSGRWEVEVATPAASRTTYYITIAADGEVTTISNILVGEVWFCSGQSNMEMPLGGFWNCPVEGANEAIAQSGKYKDLIRVCTVQRDGAQTPQDDVRCQWDECRPQNAARFSAVGYFFARTLSDILDIPVGIINCSWGGSCVEGWLPKDILLTYPDGLTPIDDTDYHAKMIMFNGMLHPLAGYTIKGFLWNQGESNVGRTEEYVDRFQTMTRLWRQMWRQPADKLPIYSVELPPYIYGNGPDGQEGPEFRSCQHLIPTLLENSGCISTADLIYAHEGNQIHGTKKLEIGQRLAYMAAVRDYGVDGIVCDAPEFESLTVEDSSADDASVVAGSKVSVPQFSGKVLKIYFTNSFDGFDRMSDIEGFEVQDASGKWHEATAWSGSEWQGVARQGCFLKVACPGVSDMKAVRYCYKNFTIATLHSLRGLPVVPFLAEIK